MLTPTYGAAESLGFWFAIPIDRSLTVDETITIDLTMQGADSRN